MKKYIITPLVLTILLTGVVSAQVSSTSKNKIDVLKQKITNIKEKTADEKDKIKQKNEQEKNNLKSKIASTTEKLKEKKQELKTAVEIRIGKKLDDKKNKIADNFEKSIQNLKDLILKIDSRISKMETSGANTTLSKSLLETAVSKVALAETELTNLENVLAKDIPTSTSTKKIERKALLQNIKIQSEKTKTAIKVAHQSIINTINSLKPGQVKIKNSTSTLEATSTNNQ